MEWVEAKEQIQPPNRIALKSETIPVRASCFGFVQLFESWNHSTIFAAIDLAKTSIHVVTMTMILPFHA